jgi:hypothetical protein
MKRRRNKSFVARQGWADGMVKDKVSAIPLSLPSLALSIFLLDNALRARILTSWLSPWEMFT